MLRLRPGLVSAGLLTAVLSSSTALALRPQSGLAGSTILVIRHGEKPAEGFELAPAGVARANSYPDFFRHYRIDGKPVRIDYIFATKDSKGSHRETLTVAPLAKSLRLKVDDRFKNKEVADLADAMKAKSYGKTVLICWHHGKIPDLLTALGANPASLLPEGKWPNDTFDWVVQLRYDANGKLLDATKHPWTETAPEPAISRG